jgi:DNA-binding transcriptional LysR family regulator
METRELRYFVAVAEELHFARAAARVGIEQSPLSKAITEMERHLGVRLFVRTRRSTRLTFVGETLLPDARRILAEVEQALRNVKAAASGRRGRLRVAIDDGIADPRIARLIAQSRAEDSGVDIQILHAPSPVQVRDLYAGVLDVGFSLTPCHDREMGSVPVWKDPVVLIMRPDHPLAADTRIQHIDADTGALILLGERLSAGTEPIDAWLLSSPQTAKSIEYVASIELLLTMVAAGYGAGLLSVAQAETHRRPDLIMRPLQIPGAITTTYLLHRHDDPSSVVVRFVARAGKML